MKYSTALTVNNRALEASSLQACKWHNKTADISHTFPSINLHKQVVLRLEELVFHQPQNTDRVHQGTTQGKGKSNAR